MSFRKIIFNKGIVEIVQSNEFTEIDCLFSVISNGTERRQLSETKNNQTSRVAGYMSVGKISDGYVLSAGGHASGFNRDSFSDLVIDPSIATNYYDRIVVARFQLIMYCAIEASIWKDLSFIDESISIIGSGPVAIGAGFEVIRRGAREVVFITDRYQLLNLGNKINFFKYSDVPDTHTRYLVDSSGALSIALGIALDNAILNIGILGYPGNEWVMNPYIFHRKSISLTGLHELNVDTISRGDGINKIITWHKSQEFDLSSLVQYWVEDSILQCYQIVINKQYKKPFNVIKWSL